MVEYINREAIWFALNVACVPYNRAMAKVIEDIPAADVRPVARGKWKHHKDSAWCGGGCTKCSACGFGYSDEYYHEVAEFNFCPNCGADMREES